MPMRAGRFPASAMLALLAISTASACRSLSNQDKGVLIGAGTGGAVGGVIGKQVGSTAAGIIIGATVGGTVGGIIGHQMDQQAKELEQNIPGATVTRVGEGIVVTFNSGLLFDFDSDQLRSDARQNLTNLATSLDHYPNTDVVIIGHTDSVGTDTYNQRLSERRAAAAKAYLATQSVDPARLKTMGMGESDPVASNSTEDGRQKNRRVEVTIYADKAYRESLGRQASR